MTLSAPVFALGLLSQRERQESSVYIGENMMNKIFALGFFDGVHLGHQALLDACRRLAENKGCAAGVVTFASHPDTLVIGKTPPLINTIEERQRILMGHGMRNIMVLPFDEKLMNTPWQDFLEDLIQKGAVGFVCGDDFRFGFRGEGTAQLLEEFCQKRGLTKYIVRTQALDGIRISSTHIRQYLEAGDMEQANRFLGHPHILSGKVISGRGLGHTLGFPTANIALPAGVVCPKHGAYACKAIVDGQVYLAVTNIGNRPTVGGHHVTVEAWLLDFEGDLYGKTVVLEFYKFLRPEKKFDSLEELRAEIQKNALQTRKFFGKS